MDWLLYLQPFGLSLDIIGFWLVVRFGHALFLRIGTTLPRPDEGRNGDVYLQIPRDESEGESKPDRRECWANVGVYLVIIGFIAQLIAALASLLQ